MGLLQPDERYRGGDRAAALGASPPAIVVHGLPQALAALQAAADLDMEITLMSAPGAAAYGGPAWFMALAREAMAAVPNARASAVLDCGDKPGFVLAALRCGFASVRFSGPVDMASQLAAIAGQSGARILTGPVEALDLEGCGDVTAACRDWLAQR
jgi:hypothetical protein